MIDYVKEQTKFNKIAYVAHSQGTLEMFSALSFNYGDIQNKINIFIALSPVLRLESTEISFFIMLA